MTAGMGTINIIYTRLPFTRIYAERSESTSKRAKESVILSICYKLLYDEQISSQFKLDNSMSTLMHIQVLLLINGKENYTPGKI